MNVSGQRTIRRRNENGAKGVLTTACYRFRLGRLTLFRFEQDEMMKRWLDAVRRLIDPRREPRDALPAGHALLIVDGQSRAVRLFDLSDSGAKVAYSEPLEPGESVILQMLDRDPLHGQVRWSRDGRIGIGFAAPELNDDDEERLRK